MIAAARGRGDLTSRRDEDWDFIGRELKQDAIRAVVEKIESGGARMRPSADLPAGEYAVVIRPTSKRKVSGASVLSPSGLGRVMTVVWDFAIK